jgi:hypothetical protein
LDLHLPIAPLPKKPYKKEKTKDAGRLPRAGSHMAIWNTPAKVKLKMNVLKTPLSTGNFQLDQVRMCPVGDQHTA